MEVPQGISTMTKRDVIVRALQKSKDLPLDMQAAAVEMYLEVADELAPEVPALVEPPVAVAAIINQGIGSTSPAQSPIIVAASMEEIPRIAPDVEASAPGPDRPCRSFVQLVNDVKVPQAIEVIMGDGKPLRIGLRTVPSQEAEIVRVVSYVPVGPDGGVEGPSAVFTRYEKDLRIEEKIGNIADGVRCRFKPVKDVVPIEPMMVGGDFRANCVKVAEEPEGTPMRESDGNVPRSIFHELAKRVVAQ